MIKVFIGYDPTESIAYHVLAHSIMRRSSMPVSITPIRRSTLGSLYTRPRMPNESTEFSMTRFLVPHLCDYRGWAIFLDCDMLVTGDIAELWKMRDQRYAVQVVKHDYTPIGGRKMLGAEQTAYPKKNWSSVMLMNAAKCASLTTDYVNTASGLELHQFKWIDHPCEIGALPRQWNWLVGEYTDPPPDIRLLHWTLGGPWWHQYQAMDFAELWREELGHLLHESEEDKRHAATRLLQTAARGELEAAAARTAASA